MVTATLNHYRMLDFPATLNLKALEGQSFNHRKIILVSETPSLNNHKAALIDPRIKLNSTNYSQIPERLSSATRAQKIVKLHYYSQNPFTPPM